MSAATLRSLWLSARARLSALPSGEAERDARLLIQAAFRLTPASFTAELSRSIAADDPCLQHLDWMLTRRAQRWPVSHILGEAPFWGRMFEVTRDTLAPRADTETLVSQALSVSFDRLLDLGTGTGCLGVTLLAERAGARGTATDISQAALAVAERNAARQGVTDRLALVCTDWAEGLTGRFDLIVSNPPYITQDAFGALMPEVREHEPQIALTPGGDGLAAYRQICAAAPVLLTPGGWLMVEVGFDQGPAVQVLMEAAGLEHVEVVQDLTGTDRVVKGQNRPLML